MYDRMISLHFDDHPFNCFSFTGTCLQIDILQKVRQLHVPYIHFSLLNGTDTSHHSVSHDKKKDFSVEQESLILMLNQ
jgi:hypothetical protein